MEGLSRLKDSLYYSPKTRLMLDWGGMGLTDSYFDEMREKLAGAFEAMDRLEKGAIANPSEERMVGHYWLRNAEMAPRWAAAVWERLLCIIRCRPEVGK